MQRRLSDGVTTLNCCDLLVFMILVFFGNITHNCVYIYIYIDVFDVFPFLLSFLPLAFVKFNVILFIYPKQELPTN